MARRVALAAALLLTLAACVTTPVEDGLTYSGPGSPAVEGTVRVPGASRAEAVAGVAQRLRSAGFRIDAADPRSGTVVARRSGPGLVDCGTFTQKARGNVTRFAAHAPRAALFDTAKPGTIVLREVAAHTRVMVEIGTVPPFAARIGATNTLRISQKPATSAGKGWREERSFASGSSVTFPDQVKCVQNDRLAGLVAGE